MKDSLYYYGVSAFEFKNMKYTEALRHKIEAAKRLLNKLTNELFLTGVESNRWSETSERINDVVKAINFNKRLLEECGERV